MLCRYCQQVELTMEEEMSSKKGCMFCAVDSALQMSRATGMTVPMPKPHNYGRTQQEYDAYMQKVQKAATKRTAADQMEEIKNVLSKEESTAQPKQHVQRPGQPYEYSQDHIGNLLKDYDPDEPPHEYEEILNDDFFIKASVPGPLNDKMDSLIAKEIKRLFTMIVYLKTQGSSWERYFRDPDEPQGPQGAFPPM